MTAIAYIALGIFLFVLACVVVAWWTFNDTDYEDEGEGL